MNVSYRWLRELVEGLQLSPQEVADRLAMLGAPVDEVLDLGGPLRDIVIGRVEQAARHPNADRLSLCTVDAGAGYTVQVVCGAPNVKAGAYYPFAPVGATLPGGVTIRRAKIRGEESQGMLCSPRELGLGRDHEGIMELTGDFAPGRSFIEALGLDDARLTVDVTPNRPDLLSHLGIAREIAASTGLEAQLHPLPGAPALPDLTAADGGNGSTGAAAGNGDPSTGGTSTDVDPSTGGAAAGNGDGPARGAVAVSIDDVDLCPRYYGLVIRGVRIGPSPEWLAARLRAIGLRPISNVVDATNFVLHELGQPLHAFDLDRLGDTVVVRRARAGERLTTLDGVDRVLAAGMLVIADAARPVAIAGVMGGADTEVQHDTRDLLLECALFEPASVRATRRAFGLSTDASYRFERGVDPDGMLRAVRRAAELITAVAGGAVDRDIAVAGPGLPAAASVRLRLRRVAQVLGEAFSGEMVAGLLRPLGFTVATEGDAVIVGVPGYRRYDVHREEDLIEEIARRHGYDAFSEELRPFRPGTVPSHPLFRMEDRLRTLLAGRGFLEARTAAFAPEPEGDVALLLPLAATESRLRRALLPGLIRRVEHNFGRGARSIRLFELGTVFAAGGADGLPREATHVAVVFTGNRRPPHWTESGATFDVWDLKGVAGALAAELGMRLEESADDPLLDTALSFRLAACENDELRGVAGRIRAGRIDAPAWAEDVWGLEIALGDVVDAGTVRYRELPAFPAIERDLALLVPDSIPAARVAAVIRTAAVPLLESVDTFDVYSGAGVPEGSRSVAYRLRFRAPDRTLTDAEADDAIGRTLQQLNEEMGVRQRG
jgi:phenylalanyl-tRNA synthetase beta chain